MSLNMCKWILAAIVVVMCMDTSDGCSCRLTHPQEQYCNSDFVILARVKKEFTYNDTRVYKVKIRKPFKMSEKSPVALKSGRLLTSSWDSMCGVKLEKGKLYVIGGKIHSLKAHINLCGLTERWEYLTQRQKKGLNRLYRLGCTCGIKACFKGPCPKSKNFCNWTTFNFNSKLDCQRTQGICVPSASKACSWARNKMQLACMRNQTLITPSTMTHKHSLTNSLWSG